MKKTILYFLIVLLFSACSQVPKQSVELSATVGRDLAKIQKSHIQLAELLFERMKNDVNRFVDNVYAPYQIAQAMKNQQKLAKEHDNRSLLLAINYAFKEDASTDLQAKVIKGMEIFIKTIHDDIEKMRKEMLKPLEKQENEVLNSINESYKAIHYANSIVTGHLASVVKVHESQNELLQELGIEKNLRTNVAQELSKASEKISSYIDKAQLAENKIDNITKTAQSIKEEIRKIDNIFKKQKE